MPSHADLKIFLIERLIFEHFSTIMNDSICSFLRTSFSFEKKLRVKAPTQGRQIGAILALEMLKVTYIQGCDDALGIF